MSDLTIQVEDLQKLIQKAESDILKILRDVQAASDDRVTISSVDVTIQPEAFGIPSSVVGVGIQTQLSRLRGSSS